MPSYTSKIRKRWKAIIETEGYIDCGICTMPITKSGFLDGVKLGKVSVDHIIAKANGGRTIWDNLQPAHQLCNEWKADS